jgi:hypothetical protein
MLIKEMTHMKRLFTVFTVVFVMLLVASSAFAGAPPQKPAGMESQGYTAYAPAWDPWEFDPAATILGSVWDFEFWLTDPYGFLAPYHPVDIYLWQPSTLSGWPLTGIGPTGWYVPIGESELRRQSWPAYQGTDMFGYYYSEFMLPRDEAWYPCSFPCKWKCNFWDPIAGTEIYHSPMASVYVYRPGVGSNEWSYLYYPLYWPFKFDGWWWYGDPYDVTPSTVDPQDTVAPLTAWAVEASYGSFIENAYWEFEVLGYFWSTRDLEMEWPLDWPYICTWQ